MAEDEMADEAMEDDAMEDEAMENEPVATEPVVQTVASGSFEDSAIHAGSGDAVVLTDGNQTFLRFEENFSTDNGPDLNVYLRANDGSDDYIDLGDLKGNIGSQNYEIPAGTDLSRFTVVDIWCVRFGVSFTEAELA
ncbi:MAG: DM13 domain-containing protein [Acidimicrobiales bacterium]|nr:DM13 domain-containing protein [Acidimicrobiales bacterium]